MNSGLIKEESAGRTPGLEFTVLMIHPSLMCFSPFSIPIPGKDGVSSQATEGNYGNGAVI
jgi:hypothetical protein